MLKRLGKALLHIVASLVWFVLSMAPITIIILAVYWMIEMNK